MIRKDQERATTYDQGRPNLNMTDQKGLHKIWTKPDQTQLNLTKLLSEKDWKQFQSNKIKNNNYRQKRPHDQIWTNFVKHG